jgi:hypothetical protein
MEQNDAISPEETVIEQSDSTSGVTPYELATLASRICPERCFSDPEEAIAAAENLLREAGAALWRAYQEEREKEWEQEEAQMPRINWIEAVKQITGQERRDRAVKRFLHFIEHDAEHNGLPGRFAPCGSPKQQLEYKRRQGFTHWEVSHLQREFTSWTKEPKRKKGKQGRRISEHDSRLRTPSVRLLPTKPRKPI